MATTTDQLLFQIHQQTIGRSAVTATITVNPASASRLAQRMQPYKAMPNKFRPALEGIADYVRDKMIPSTFSNEGPGWRPLSMRTRRERTAQGFPAEHPILVRTRDLFKELTDKSHPKHIESIYVGPHSRIIIGGSSEKFMRNQLGNATLNIPIRPMIPGTGWLKVNQTDKDEIMKIFEDKVKESMHA